MGSLGTLPDPLDINDRVDTTITAADEIVYADATDSAAIKKDTVQGILDLAEIVKDTSPQLGANLDILAFNITSSSTIMNPSISSTGKALVLGF